VKKVGVRKDGVVLYESNNIIGTYLTITGIEKGNKPTMTQSRIGSSVESLVNVLIGISVGLLSNLIVLPLFGYDVTFNDSLWIAIVFTAISFVRSYIVRRVFNKYNFWSK
jgi:hypothetical protein